MKAILHIFLLLGIAACGFLVWMFQDFRKYKKQNRLPLLLLLLMPLCVQAQYIDRDCQIAFKWHENQRGRLEYRQDGLVYSFVPGSQVWEVIIGNETEETAYINWSNAQFIVNGRASEILVDAKGANGQGISAIAAHSEIRGRLSAARPAANRTSYNALQVSKGNRAAITIILPIGIGGRPQFFHTFDFVVTQRGK